MEKFKLHCVLNVVKFQFIISKKKNEHYEHFMQQEPQNKIVLRLFKVRSLLGQSAYFRQKIAPRF